MVFGVVLVVARVKDRRLKSVKLSILSFFTSVLLLLTWNFFMGFLLMGKSSGGGVSTVLSSAFSIVILFLYSLIVCIVHYLYERLITK